MALAQATSLPVSLKAMSAPLLGHLDRFRQNDDEIKAMLRIVFQTSNEMTFPVSGNGQRRHGVFVS